MTNDFEWIADEVLRLADVDEMAPAKPVALVRALLGPGALFSVHARSLPGDGSLAVVNGQPRIYIRQGLSPIRRRWVICHELAEWWLWQSGVRDEQIEGVADAVAAAVLAPRRAVRAALKSAGPSYTGLAEHFGTTESCIAMRLAEVTGRPMALVAPAKVRVRGEDYAWPEEGQIRSLRWTRRAGLERMKLHDDRRRVVLSA